MDMHLRCYHQAIEHHQPSLALLSVPFPGAMYAALRIAQVIKVLTQKSDCIGWRVCQHRLRELSEPRIFDFVDFITWDSGERPLLALLDHLAGKRSVERLVRTYSQCEQSRNTSIGGARYTFRGG
jgi:hypothetical protein